MDKIGNNYYKYDPKAPAPERGSLDMLSKEEKMDILVPKCSDLLTKRAEREVPENGKFRRIFVAFEIPETQNETLFSIEPDAKDFKDIRRMSIAVHRKNSDRIISNYMFKGTKEEVLNYLKDEKNYAEFKQTVNSLSNSVDEYYSSL